MNDHAELEKAITTITTTLVAAHKLAIPVAADKAVEIIEEARARAHRLAEEWRQERQRQASGPLR